MSGHHCYPLSSDAVDLYGVQTTTSDVIAITQALFAAPQQPVGRTQYCQHVLSRMGVTADVLDIMGLKSGHMFISLFLLRDIFPAM